MPDELLDRLRRFHDDAFPQYRQQFQALVDEGQHPTTLFIGCSDSRLVPYLLTGAGPGELFLVRNVGAFIPPYDGSHGHHGTTAAIEFAVLNRNSISSKLLKLFHINDHFVQLVGQLSDFIVKIKIYF